VITLLLAKGIKIAQIILRPNKISNSLDKEKAIFEVSSAIWGKISVSPNYKLK